MNDIEEAISKGLHHYWDEDANAEGRSGGVICPKCRKWTTPPRKRKHLQATFMSDCESCEIKDPFRRMWHEFNRSRDDDQRKMHNQWLAEVRELVGELQFFPDDQSKKKMRLHKLLQQIPFFEG